MRILLSGYYGFGNVGDEAVLEAIIQGLNQREPDSEITVLSANRFNWLALLSEIWKTEVLISGGGTLFQDSTSAKSFLYYIGIVFLAKLFGKKAVVFAQGFGPLRSKLNQLIARFVLSKVDLITLRDEDSFMQIKRIGVKNRSVYVTADPTALLDIPNPDEGKRILSLEGVQSGRPLLGIAVRNVSEERIFLGLGKVIEQLVKKYNYYPVFLLFQCPEDMSAASKVMGAMQEKSSVIFRICRPHEMLAITSQLDLLIGMRLHALIFAAMNAVPMLGIAYDPKVESFMKTINQPCVKLDAENMGPLIENIIRDKLTVKSELQAKRKMLAEKADLNYEYFYREIRETAD